MADSLSSTLNQNKVSVDDVFVELRHNNKLGLPKSDQLRLFHTTFRANKFTYETMQEFLYRNLAKYVFSRAKMEEFTQNEELDIAVSQAQRIMKENGGAGGQDVGNALDEILLYSFLDEKLKAPRLRETSWQKSTKSNNYHLWIHLQTQRERA